MRMSVCFMLLLVLSSVALAQDEAAEELRTLVAESTLAIDLQDGVLRGPGADLLREEAARSHFFLLGEQHATADIARVALAIWTDLHSAGYEHLAVEIGPYGTRRLEGLLRDGGISALEGFLSTGDNLLTFPFAFYAEEADLLAAVVRDSADPARALWGLDQEFIAGGRVVLEELAELTTTDEQRTAVAAARDAAAQNVMWLGVSDPAAFADLQSAFAGNAAGEGIVEAVILSNRIYAPFTGRGGSVYLANEMRERQMKRLFAEAFQDVRARTGEPPRVFLKFGANHLAAGHSPTNVLSLGNFVREFGEAMDLASYAVHVDCQGGQVTDPRSGEHLDCESYFLGESSDLAALLPDEPLALLDLRALRGSMDRFSDWDERSRTLILAYDSVLFVRDAAPATVVGQP